MHRPASSPTALRSQKAEAAAAAALLVKVRKSELIDSHSHGAELALFIAAQKGLLAELKELLSKVVAATREGKPAHAWRAESITRLLTLQDECLEAFAACAAESRRRAKDA